MSGNAFKVSFAVDLGRPPTTCLVWTGAGNANQGMVVVAAARVNYLASRNKCHPWWKVEKKSKGLRKESARARLRAFYATHDNKI